MARRRNEYQEDAILRVLQIITKYSQITSREVAQKLGISNSSEYYLLISLIGKGFVKVLNFSENKLRKKHNYLLTLKGIREKSFMIKKSLKRKKLELEAVKEEIYFLKEYNDDIFEDNQ